MSLAKHDPDYESDIEPLPPSGVAVLVRLRVGEEHIRPLFVIVEMYARKQYGRGRRAWENQFSQTERKIISRWYGRLYDYYLRTGMPRQGVEMMPGTLELLQRAANFFASL